MSTAIVLFNRDLRTHDHPGLHAAAAFDQVIPLFIHDPAFSVPPNRAAFLADSLRDLNAALTRLGAPLTVRRGDPVAILVELVAAQRVDAVFASADFTPIAVGRERALASVATITLTDGVACVAPGRVTPAGGESYKVFTSYWHRWRQHAGSRPVLAAPRRLKGVRGLASLPIEATLPTATALARGGESVARSLLAALTIDGYASGGHDDLPGDRTSRLSPYLHFGCVSAREVLARAADLGPDGDEFARQLCWRDFFLQHTAAQPVLREKLHPMGAISLTEPFRAWADGRTGYPVVDAGMRQLVREGWMHNRARMITASFLVKDLAIDWSVGAAYFMWHLVDADVANNNGNWKWVAGVELNTRPGRVLNPLRQAQRFDRAHEYVRRYVPEFGTDAYPLPIIDPVDLASARLRRA